MEFFNQESSEIAGKMHRIRIAGTWKKYEVLLLTDNVQMKVMRFQGNGWYLAVVNSLVSFLRPFYTQRPFRPFAILTGILCGQSLKPLVTGVSVTTGCEDVYIPMSDPGYLWTMKKEKEKRTKTEKWQLSSRKNSFRPRKAFFTFSLLFFLFYFFFHFYFFFSYFRYVLREQTTFYIRSFDFR